MEANHTGDKPIIYDMPTDELTQHEMQEAIRIMRTIKRNQRGYMLVSPTTGSGRGLYIVGPLEKNKAA